MTDAENPFGEDPLARWSAWQGVAVSAVWSLRGQRALGLTAMADAFIELQNAPDAGELSREDWLGLLAKWERLFQI